MLQTLFGNRGQDLEALLKSSLTLFAEPEIRRPSFRQFQLSTLNHLLFLVGFLAIYYKGSPGFGTLCVFVSLAILTPYSFFNGVRMRATQSWLIYAFLTGKPVSGVDARERTETQKWNLRLFAFIEILFATSAKSGNSSEDSGIFSALTSIVLSGIRTVFDVAESYLLPALVIEQTNLAGTVRKLEGLRENVPATLVGAFGFDLFGGALSLLTFGIQIGIVLISAGIGILVSPFVGPASVSALPNGVTTFVPLHPTSICLVPFFVGIGVASLYGSSLRIFISSLKNAYFSAFYVSIHHGMELLPHLQEQLTNYLNRGDTSYVETLKSAAATKFPTLAKGPTPANSTEEIILKVIDGTFRRNLEAGQKPAEIAAYLRQKGYLDAQIELVRSRYEKSA